MAYKKFFDKVNKITRYEEIQMTPPELLPKGKLEPWTRREDIYMEKINDYYTITLIDHAGKYKHINFEVKLRAKNIQQCNENTTANINHSWTVRALVDTGSTICGITKKLVNTMGLKPVGEDRFIDAAIDYTAPIYVLDVIFPKDKIFENIETAEVRGNHSCDFIIGMNILSLGDMALTSAGGKMCFSFISPPREKYIDFNEDYL